MCAELLSDPHVVVTSQLSVRPYVRLSIHPADPIRSDKCELTVSSDYDYDDVVHYFSIFALSSVTAQNDVQLDSPAEWLFTE